MPRTIWTKPQSDPNGTWTRFDIEPPATIPATGGLAYDVALDTGEAFVVTPLVSTVAPIISGVPVLSGFAQVGQTLGASSAPVTGTAPITTSWQWLRDGAVIAGETGATYMLSIADEGAEISVRQTETNIVGSASATSTTVMVAPQTTGGVAQISSLFVSDQAANGEVVLTYAIDQASEVAGVVTTQSAAPTAAQISAGQNENGSAAASAFTDSWGLSGPETLPDIVSGLSAGTYFLHVLPVGGSDVDVVSSNGFQLETQAPVVLEALTSTSGFDVTLTFNEDLSGTTDAADWTVTADGASIEVSGATMTGPEITVSLSAQITAGQAVLVSYSGSALVDLVANSVVPFGDRAVINQVSGTFTEQAVQVSAGTYLTANAPLPTGQRGMLFFASLAQEAGFEARTAIMSWNGVGGGVHADYTTGNGLVGTRMRIQDGTANITASAEPVPLGTRYHLLSSSWIDGTDTLHATAWIYDVVAGTWVEAISGTDNSVPGATLSLGPDPVRIFARSNATSHQFRGTVYRVALWAGAGQIADISQAAVRDAFANGPSIADPALSRANYGQPLVDFAGDSAAYNNGSQTGSLGAFTATGTFT